MESINLKIKKKIFFIGIGGISMSSLSLILKHNGYEVLGSDNNVRTTVIENLKNNGIKVYEGHKKEHITNDIDLVVYTSAVHNDNEEMIETKNKGIDCIQRSVLLGLIMKDYKNSINVAGTHGKTTITSIISKILVDAKYEPTITVGGILKDIGGNLYIGKNDLFVAEACEYTNSFLDFFPTIEVISNIEEDHLDFFKDINDIRNSFSKFIEKMDENGLLIINNNINDINYLTKDFKGRVLTYGIDCEADYVGKNIKNNDFGQSFELYKNNKKIGDINISILGKHNVENSVASIATLLEYGVDFEVIKESIINYYGADRRLEKKGVCNGFTIIDDYAHHPSEIRASLNALKTMKYNKMYLLYQPHTYSRTKKLFNDFVNVLKEADNVVLIDIYAAREKNTYNISSEDLANAINDEICDKATYIKSMDEAKDYLLNILKKGDLLVTMGAGDVYKVGDKILDSSK